MKWVSILIKVWTSGGILPSFRKNRMQSSLLSFSLSVALTMKNWRLSTKQRFTIFWDIFLKSSTEQWKQPAGYWKCSETRNEILGKANNGTMREWRCSLYRHLSIEDNKAEWWKCKKFWSTCSTKLPVKTYNQIQEILAEIPESWKSENQNRIAETSFLVVALSDWNLLPENVVERPTFGAFKSLKHSKHWHVMAKRKQRTNKSTRFLAWNQNIWLLWEILFSTLQYHSQPGGT